MYNPTHIVTSKTDWYMKRINKYLYGWKLYVDYGNGWEYEVFEETRKGYLENKRLYNQNCPYPTKWSRGRELNPEYKPNLQTA